MKRVILIFFLFSLFLHATSVKEKIAKNKKSLQNKSKIERRISRKIDTLAKDIIKSERSLKTTDKNIEKLEIQIKKLVDNSQKATDKLNSLISENQNLIKTKKDLEEKIVAIIADKFSFYLVADKGYQENLDSVIGDAVLDKMDSILKDDFNRLSQDYKRTNDNINNRTRQIEQIKKSLSSLKSKQKSLQELRKKREKDISVLKIKRKGYKKKLDKIVAQKKELRSILRQLKIVELEEKELELKSDESEVKSKSSTKNKRLSVKKIGSSYHKSRVKRYRGRRTISPLESYTVKQKFGNYVVPVYNIKSFNESVVLRSKKSNAKVRNVLSGKVIFAKDTPMSGKVIIVENRLGIHTIYAHLSKIAPTIRVGKKIKKGYVIGRVLRDLTFEVTQKNYHINPLQLIR